MRDEIKKNAGRKNRPQWQVMGGGDNELVIKPNEASFMPTPMKEEPTGLQSKVDYPERDDIDFSLSDNEEEDFTRSNLAENAVGIMDTEEQEDLIMEELSLQESLSRKSNLGQDLSTADDGD